MMPLVSPHRLQRYRELVYWTAGKAAIMAAVYPDGTLVTFADHTDLGWTGVVKPTGCDSITQYTIDDPGGRTGGTVSYAYLLIPSAPPLGKCVVFAAGHCSGDANWTQYADSVQSEILVALLAAGYHVLIADLPNYGTQPTQKVVLGGSLVEMAHNAGHIPGNTASDDGPALIRLYLDHFIRGMNTVTRDLEITTFALLGHSGGGATAASLAAVESRFSAVHILQGSQFTLAPTYGARTDWETYSGNESMAAIKDTYRMMCLFSAAFAGRKTVIHSADGDEYTDAGANLGASEAMRNWIDGARSWIEGNYAGARLSNYRKTDASADPVTPNHSISPNQVAYVVSHLQANL